MLWTQKVQEALEKNQKERQAEFDRKRKDIKGIMTELSAICLEEMDRLKRTKVETLVTIHVHQTDLFEAIRDGVKGQKHKDGSQDFDWLKNTRIYWKHDEEHVNI